MRVFIKGWKVGSSSAKELRNGLGAKLIRAKNSRYVHNQARHLVVNWGDSRCDDYGNMLNRPSAVKKATDKISTIISMDEHGVSSLGVMYDKEIATRYLINHPDSVIFCRGMINASKGKGIVVARSPDELIDCKLYTVGILDPDRIEYRIHVFQGKVIHQQQKKKRNGWRENPNFSGDVRNLDGGWVFAIKDVDASEHTKSTAIKAVEALGLDFGGVDIVQEPSGTGYVIEVNTACGLHGTTIDMYCEAIKKYAEDL